MPARTYDQVAPHYDAAIRPLELWFLARWRASTLSRLPNNARILEVGAGTGLNFAYYPPNASGIATEPSTEMLRIAALKERPSKLKLLQSCGEALPFEDATFDAAFATLVFCSVKSPAEVFAELRRVMKPGGLLLLLEHVRPGNVLGPVFDLLNLLTVPLFDDHFNRRTANAARSAGFEVERIEKTFLGIINLIVCRL